MEFRFVVEGGDFTKAGTASSQVKKILKQINADPKDIKRLVVALYEAEVNIVAHAFRGEILANIEPDHVTIRLIDEGPGIPDIPMAMQQGFSTASSKVREMGFGAGMGLPNIKKNTDELKIDSVVGKGTTIEMTVFFQKNQG
jgi:anti-sigma regulatory factor (Ser/Thr protein kinase)